MKRSKKLPIGVFTTLCLIMVIAIYYANVKKPRDIPNECNITQESCVFVVDQSSLEVEFLQTPISEEELTLKFKTNNGLKIVNVWIEGVNMYMGKTPVLFETDENIGITFLGSCNLAEMKWRLNIEVQNKKGEILKDSAFFYTYR